jgi:hypothetical protein
MSDATSILVLSACTATKANEAADRTILAEDLYAGQQHRRLMRGIAAYRGAGQPAGPLELHIISAGYGVIAAHKPIRTYNATFVGLRQSQLRRRSARLGVPGAVAELLAVRRRLAVILLGDSYLRAAQLSSTAELGAPTLVFTSPGGVRRLPILPGLHPIALSNKDASRFSCGLVALKGELAARLLVALIRRPDASIPFDRAGLLRTLDAGLEPKGVRLLHQDLAEVA